LDNLILKEGICGRSTLLRNESYHDERGFLSKIIHNQSFPLLKSHQSEVFFTKNNLGTFRGLHLQYGVHSAEKLIVVTSGRISYYQVDIEELSTLKTAYNSIVDSRDLSSIYVPSGVAHGYLALEENTTVMYFQNVPFCSQCDTGVKSNKVLQHARSLLGGANLVMSERDLNMDSFVIVGDH
jgi:dTDP-4-dehydrorhamnose 3,5-epimerase-like enzyme